MSIRLKLEGFEEMLKAIEKAESSADNAAEACLKKSAVIMESELKAQMQAADYTDSMSRLISRMPSYSIERDHGRITARVGYKKGAYNPDNPSDGYKVVFLNYGTPHRKVHGQVVARGFIQKAKSRAKPKMYKVQKQTLDEILRGLKG